MRIVTGAKDIHEAVSHGAGVVAAVEEGDDVVVVAEESLPELDFAEVGDVGVRNGGAEAARDGADGGVLAEGEDGGVDEEGVVLGG